MDPQQIPQRDNSWDFSPLKDLDPIFPPVSWHGYLIAGFSSRQSEPLVFDAHDFPTAFRACHQEISLAEAARLFAKVEDHALFSSMNWDRLIEIFGWKWNDHLKKTFHSLVQTPMTFQNWASRRKFGIQDWSLLNALPSIPRISPLLLQIAGGSFSYQSGRQAMELGIELFLKGDAEGTAPLLKAEDETENAWLQRLHNLRHPISARKDLAAKEKLKSLPVPPHVRMDWRRNGDLSGLQVEFFAHSPEELQKKLERLTGFERLLTDGENSPWRAAHDG